MAGHSASSPSSPRPGRSRSRPRRRSRSRRPPRPWRPHLGAPPAEPSCFSPDGRGLRRREVDEAGYDRLTVLLLDAYGEPARTLGVDEGDLDRAIGSRLDISHGRVGVRACLLEVDLAVPREALSPVLLALALALRPHDCERKLALRHVLVRLAVAAEVEGPRGR